jgi:hypothetical protein
LGFWLSSGDDWEYKFGWRVTAREPVAETDLMRFQNVSIVAVLLVGIALADTEAASLRLKVTGIRYPSLARAARVQGDVGLRLNSGAVTLLSGPPLLRQSAAQSAKDFLSIQGETNLELTYHFALVPTAIERVPVTVKRGNSLARVVLRMFGDKTEKTVYADQCQENVPPANVLKITGTVGEIWIFGAAPCPMFD